MRSARDSLSEYAETLTQRVRGFEAGVCPAEESPLAGVATGAFCKTWACIAAASLRPCCVELAKIDEI